MSSITGASVVDTVDHGPGSGDKASTGRTGDRLLSGAATGAGIFVITLVVLVGAFLVSRAAPALAANQANFFTSRVFSVDGGTLRFGIADLLW